MLGKRYEYDGQPLLKLTPAQLDIKRLIEAKLDSGQYQWEQVPCCVCGAGDLEALAAKDRYGFKMTVAVCRGCGLVQTNPRMNADAYTNFYQQHYRALYSPSQDMAAFFTTRRSKGATIFAFLKEALQSGGLVLEVGCASGGILHAFRERGCRVMGIDLDAEYVAYGRDQHGLDLRAAALDAFEPEERPNLVLYVHTLEHILDPLEELRRIRDLLPDDGLLYVEVPGVKYLHRSYEMDFLRYLQNAHVYHFSRTSLTNLLHKAGFSIVKSNEWVQVLARKSAPVDSTTSDYPAVARYLRRIELLRRVLPVSPQTLVATLRRTLRRLRGKQR
ncbi:MAG: class I SAM-dependent methyltransferase [Anaerolineae bacterium]|nr:class I SAM-dependent methyltransferase [Anaerolineae bacterium]